MKLLDHVRQTLRVGHYSLATERSYCQWIIRYLQFHRRGPQWTHPRDLDSSAVEHFLTYLATELKVAASTQNQALNALVFLYRAVLRMNLGNFNAVRARRPVRVPTVLTVEETLKLLDAVESISTTEPYGLMARLLYGSGSQKRCQDPLFRKGS